MIVARASWTRRDDHDGNHRHHWPGRPENGLPLGSDLDEATVMLLAGGGEVADLTWEALDDIAAEPAQVFHAAISLTAGA